MNISINCSEISSFADFIEICNEGFIRTVGGEWNGNLDAFNDYLSWPEPTPYTLEIIGSTRCEEVLNYRESEKHRENVWPLLKEIFNDNSEWVNVVLK